MGETVSIQRKIFGKNTLTNVIDTKFSQLIPVEPKNVGPDPATVDTFFSDYNNLFYDIPPSGSNTSHLELVNRSSEYIGISILDMEQEIKNLREENVSLKNQLYNLTNPPSK
jgi:hypothetical protein